jgi:Transcriptional regulator, AbiEi antitoxin, Type IV TA system/Transcriptional regulator, AbiEi antitoxin N-terminal domain
MNGQRGVKLKNMLDAVPHGFLVDAAWLSRQGISRSSIYDYEQRGWLEKVTRGLYRRPSVGSDASAAAMDWRPYILSLQSIMHYDVHVGGTSALALFGHIHYIPMTDARPLYLYAEHYPAWLTRLPIRTKMLIRTRNLFGGSIAGITDRTPSPESKAGEISVGPWQWPIRASSPERAILEAINELPNSVDFDNLDMLFEGLLSLRPDLLMELLTLCRSVKVKRLFFVFADRHNHAWLKYLDRTAINLGTGPRAFVKGGKLHPTYRIYVPEEFLRPPFTGEF